MTPRAAGVLCALRRVGVAGTSLLALACGRVDTVVGTQLSPDGSDLPDAQLPRAVYLEAESGRLSGFTVATDPGVSGSEYILPPSDSQLLASPGDASATYTFTVAAGTYYLWGRIHSPAVQNNTLWITLDSGPTYLWRLSTGVIWYWKRITDGTMYSDFIPFELDAGPHELVVRNADAKVGLDRLYVTSLGDVPVPANDTPCDPPNSIQLADGGCELSCGSHGGGTCVGQVDDCGGHPLLVSYDCTICCHPPLPADGGSD